MRIFHLCGIVTLTALNSAFGFSLRAAEPTRPILECEQEFTRRQASLRSEGVSAASFFHECWWHSQRGQATVVSAGDARAWIDRSRRDPESDRVRTQSKGVAQASTSEHRRSAELVARVAKRRQARDERRVTRIIAMRAQRLALAARPSRQPKVTKVALARSRRIVLLRRTRNERIALLSRRDAERRRRYALARSQQRRDTDGAAVVEASLQVPENALQGRRSWIGTMMTSGRTKMQAVIVGPLSVAATKGSALHCWDQNVLYLSGQAGWRQSLVCDGKTEPGSSAVWFEQYDAKLW